MSGECQVNVKSLSELDIGGRETCKPHNQIPGEILILLGTHNLSVCKKLSKSDIALFANCHCQMPILASLDMVIFDVQTSCGCLKVSDFYQESDFEVDNHLRQCIQSENKLLCFCESLPCETEIW